MKTILLLVISFWYINCFGAASTYYWINTHNAVWSSTISWSLSSGGPNSGTVPGIGDTAIFDSNSGSSIVTIDVGASCNKLKMTGSTVTVDMRADLYIDHEFIGGSGVTWLDQNGAYKMNFGFTTASIGDFDPAGMFIGCNIYLDNGGRLDARSTVRQYDGNYMEIRGNASFRTNGFNVTIGSFYSSGSSTLNLSSSIFELTDDDVVSPIGFVWKVEDGSSFSLDAGTSTVKFSSTSADTKTIQLDNNGTVSIPWEFYNLSIVNVATNTFTFTSNSTTPEMKVLNIFKIANSPSSVQFFTHLQPTTLDIDGTPGNLNLFNMNGKELRMTGTVCMNYLDILNVNAVDMGGSLYFADHSNDSGGNTGITFGACPGAGFPYSFGIVTGE